MKMLYNLLLFLYFKFLIILIAGAFICMWHYSKDYYFNFKVNKFQKSIYFCVNQGLFNIFLGSIHSLAYKSPSNQLFYISLI